MCRFIESICFQDGEYPLLDLHQQRLDMAFATHFPSAKPHVLEEVLPPLDLPGKFKVRMVYDMDSCDLEWSEYQTRKIHSIKLVESNEIDYAYKYEDRTELENLYKLRGNADEILIIKNGYVTDAFYFNPVFWDGMHWYVPETCLLNGIMRQYLLKNDKVKLRSIRAEDIPSFKKISLVNALNGLGVASIGIDNIF